jgi:hypothetical protein
LPTTIGGLTDYHNAMNTIITTDNYLEIISLQG